MRSGTRTRWIAPNDRSEHVDVVNQGRTPRIDYDFGRKVAGTLGLCPKWQHNMPPTVVRAYCVRLWMCPDLRWLGNEPSAIGAVVADPDQELLFLAGDKAIELLRDC